MARPEVCPLGPPGCDAGQDREAAGQAQGPEGLAQEVNASLVNSLHARLRSIDDAREVAQEAYLRLLDAGGRARIGFPRALLFRIAQNLATDVLRRRRYREEPGGQPLAELRVDPAASPERAADARRVLDRLPAIMAQLPERTAEAFRLVRLEHLSFREAAARMQLTERMVRIHVARALVHCQEQLELSGLEWE